MEFHSKSIKTLTNSLLDYTVILATARPNAERQYSVDYAERKNRVLDSESLLTLDMHKYQSQYIKVRSSMKSTL